jgi:hypothetical protein
MMYPTTPRAGNPNSSGPMPVVMIMEEPMIRAAIMIPKVKRFELFSRVCMSRPSSSKWNRRLGRPKILQGEADPLIGPQFRMGVADSLDQFHPRHIKTGDHLVKPILQEGQNDIFKPSEFRQVEEIHGEVPKVR